MLSLRTKPNPEKRFRKEFVLLAGARKGGEGGEEGRGRGRGGKVKQLLSENLTCFSIRTIFRCD